MTYAFNHDYQSIRPADVACAHKKPKLYSSGLEEMSHEQIEAVPSCRYDDPDAIAPRAVSLREHEQSGVVRRRLRKAPGLKGRAQLRWESTRVSSEN